MNKEQLIETLLQSDLNSFRFSIWARLNNQGDLEYDICLRGSKPFDYDIHLLDIGGTPNFEYTSQLLDYKLTDA